MRTIDLVTSVIKPSNMAWWHSSWTGRLILAALLIATAVLVLMPDRTNAQATLDPDVICRSAGGVIPANQATNVGLIADCKALVAAANVLEDTLNKVDWIGETEDDLLKTNLVTGVGWDGVTVDEDKDATPPVPPRVIAVDLSGQALGGALAADWAKLDKLKDLDLSNNPQLQPSPPLGLEMVEGSLTKTAVMLTWDHTGWYTSLEGADVTHEYQYCISSCDVDANWKDATVAYTEIDGTPIDLDNNVPETKGDRAKFEVTGLTSGNEYTLGVRARKSTLVKDSDPMVKYSESSTIDVETVADIITPTPTITDEDIPNLKLTRQRSKVVDLAKYFSDGAELTEAVSSKTAIATATIVEDKLAVKITALRAGVATVTVTADGVDKTFKVTVSATNNAPQLIGNIPDQTLYLDDQGTQVDMSQFFRDQDNEFLRFIPQSSSPMVVTATVAGSSVIFKVTGLGEARMTIIAQDGAGETAFGSFTVMVLDPNAAPRTVGAIPPQTIRLEDPGLEIDAAPYFRDADGDTLTFTARSADAAILTVEVEESVVTMTAAALGETTVTVTATDPGGKSATQTVVVVVLPANNAPEVVEQIPDQMLQDDDEPLELDVTGYFIDPDGDELSYEGEGTDDSVAEVSVSSAGVARIAPKELSPGELGEVEVTVTASDPLGESVSQMFMVMVQGNLPPEAVGSIEDQVALEGRDILVEVAEYFSDPNGDELTYTAASSNPNAAQAVTIEGSQQLVIRALAPAENVTVTVTAMDPDGESAAQIITVTVAAAPAPATATPEPTAAPEPTATPAATATPAPTSTPVPTGDDGGFPVVLVIVLLLVLGGIGAAVFIIQRRR